MTDARQENAFPCPACGAPIHIDPATVGLRMRCQACGAKIQTGSRASDQTALPGPPPEHASLSAPILPPNALPPPPPDTGNATPIQQGKQKKRRKRMNPKKKAVLIAALGFLLILLALLLLLFFRQSGSGGKGSGPTSFSGEGPGQAAGSGGGGKGGTGPGSAPTGNGTGSGETTENDSAASDSDKEEPETGPDLVMIGTKISTAPPPPPPPPATPPPAGGGRAGQRGGGGGSGKPMGTGDVSFRIYWTPSVQDIDLHVIDPNQHHLWWGIKRCECQGALDRDDTKHGGPENIFWPKGQGPKGKYVYYVHYYSGHGQKTVTIEVRKAGKVIVKHKVILNRSGEQSKLFHYNLR